MNINNIKLEKAEEGLEDFVLEFLNDRFRELKTIELALNERKFREVETFTHRWKGFCRPYGFLKLEELSILLEKSCRLSKFSESQNLLSQIKEYLELKKKVIK